MADPRIYTGAEALALLETLTPGPWEMSRDGNGIIDGIISRDPSEADADWPVLGVYEHDATPLLTTTETDLRGMVAVPDLAASVAHHAARADKAEADVPRHLCIAIANAERAFRAGDFGALSTVNEYIQPLVDAAMASVHNVLRATSADREAANARAEAAEASDRQASETCADLRRQLLVVTAERDALRAAGVAVLEAWKVTEAQAADGACWQCGATIGKQHDDLCDMWEDAAREARAALKAAMVPHE